MNIALGAVLIFILLIPPIAFYFSYSVGKFAKSGPKFTLLDGLLASAIFSLLIHSLAIIILNKPVRFDILLKLLGGELKDLENKITNAIFTTALKQFALYNLIIFFVALLLGRIARYVVQRLDIHSNNELLRQKNKWWYLFRGYYLTELGFSHRDFDVLHLDAVVDTRDGTFIYSGYLVDFVCDGEELDRIYLGDVSRRIFKLDENRADLSFQHQPGEAASVPGDLFCLDYKDVRNLNLRFVFLSESVEDIQTLSDETTAQIQNE